MGIDLCGTRIRFCVAVIWLLDRSWSGLGQRRTDLRQRRSAPDPAKQLAISLDPGLPDHTGTGIAIRIGISCHPRGWRRLRHDLHRLPVCVGRHEMNQQETI